MSDQERQQERFRQKVRDRNLGNVQVQTYPANRAEASQARVLSKLELHKQHGKVQDLDGADPKPAEEKPVDTKADAKASESKPEPPVDPKPKADPKPAEDKRK